MKIYSRKKGKSKLKERLTHRLRDIEKGEKEVRYNLRETSFLIGEREWTIGKRI